MIPYWIYRISDHLLQSVPTIKKKPTKFPGKLVATQKTCATLRYETVMYPGMDCFTMQQHYFQV